MRTTRFLSLPIHSILNSPQQTGMGFWSINPYVGCEFGCSYCYARYAHRYVVERVEARGHRGTEAQAHGEVQACGRASVPTCEITDGQTDRGRDARTYGERNQAGGAIWSAEEFERRIFVKREAADVLALTLRPSRLGGHAIAIGTATDPYQPAERRYRVTRAILERLAQYHGLRVGIVTKSPLVSRDIDVLKRLSERGEVTVNISLITLDVALIRKLEPRSPMPAVRLRALEKLARAGIHAGVMIAPVLPGITDDLPHLLALLRAAKQAGAAFAHVVPLRLYPGVRPQFLPVVAREFPELLPRYQRAFDARGEVKSEYVAALRRRAGRLKREVGYVEAEGTEGTESTGAQGHSHTETRRRWRAEAAPRAVQEELAL
jgi:DNA repair photolyase